jgi:unsaturated rhamnogalacturonyl hydrolase
MHSGYRLVSRAAIAPFLVSGWLSANEPAPPPRPRTSFQAEYPVPYERPTVAGIRETLARVHAYLDRAMPTRVVDRQTGAEVTDFSKPTPTAMPERGEIGSVIDYTTGVTHSGMLLAYEVTQDSRYADFTIRHLQFIHDRLPYFRAQAQRFGKAEHTFGGILETGSLDDSGSMCAALIKARRADGTLARHRPQPESLWSDDIYMSVPALAQMGALTGDRRYTDDAVKQMLQFSKYLFNQGKGLYMHGRNLNQPVNPEFYWGRANGWAMMANVELLSVLPEDHPSRGELIELLQAHIQGVAPLQSGSGLWHQMLDKSDSYLETSVTAMFVFSIARAINEGWLVPVSYGSVAQAGWNGLTTRIDAQGRVEGTCVGTTFASDNVYYYHRPATYVASHGYGPVLLAGAEMIRLIENPKIDIRFGQNTFHYGPK